MRQYDSVTLSVWMLLPTAHELPSSHVMHSLWSTARVPELHGVQVAPAVVNSTMAPGGQMMRGSTIRSVTLCCVTPPFVSVTVMPMALVKVFLKFSMAVVVPLRLATEKPMVRAVLVIVYGVEVMRDVPS
jgi:hypothetical protein